MIVWCTNCIRLTFVVELLPYAISFCRSAFNLTHVNIGVDLRIGRQNLIEGLEWCGTIRL